MTSMYPCMCRTCHSHDFTYSSDVHMVSQAIGSYGAGLNDIEELDQIECCALPGSGSCGQFVTSEPS